jgi:ribosomal protein L40E
MKCPNCDNELKDTAKFCGKCGTKIEQAAPAANVCISCGNELKPDAKFCGKCGSKQEPAQAEAQAPAKEENPTKGYIRWELQPGQVALKLTEEIFSEYYRAKGVVIPEGYLAMVLVGGKLQSMLDAGTYMFGQKPSDELSVAQRIIGFIGNLFNGRSKKSADQNLKDTDIVTQAVNNRLPVEIIVCRSGNFSLPFTFANSQTSSITVDLGVLVSVQVSNLLALYKNILLDKTVLAAETLANELSPHLSDAVNNTCRDYAPENIPGNEALKNDLGHKFRTILNEQFGFIEFVGLVKLETSREELQRLEHLKEEMYLSEQELEQLSRRNEFMNRLSQEQNAAELQNAQNSADFNRQLASINRDNLLNEEEMAILQREIQERAEDHELERARAMDMMVLEHQQAVQESRVKMEEETGTKLFNLQMNRQRQMDDYADERRKKEMEMDKEEQLGQLDLLRQAQNIRQEREQADHDRKMDEKRNDQAHEMDKLNQFAGMSAEQIMLANPNVSAEAAKAMAEKFKAEAAEKAADSRANDAQDQMRMMKEFMETQMQAVRDMSASNAQALGAMANAKEREVERTQDMMNKNEDRYADVLKEQIKTGNMQSGKFCSSCGQKADGEQFCPECGNRIEE